MVLEATVLMGLLGQCQNSVEPDILKRLIDIESSSNPNAIAIIGAASISQPATPLDAINIAHDLDSKKFNYSVGLMQINKHNFAPQGLTIETAFDSCRNIQAGANIFADCFERAKTQSPNKPRDALLNDAASCYYSGNFTRGYQPDSNGISYIDRFNGLASSSTIKRSDVKSTTPVSKAAIEDLSPSTTNQPWDVFGDFSL
ncbi:lytic transglycosylase domain-containing protein [Photobacterium indicum]|uniref:lytic transglycosylase domain-containing protein n=1 Tax=Photobacterium indicum TaxID=81447 RepID=UPI003D10FDA4